MSLTVSPIRNAEGTIVGASKVGRDITVQKHIEKERLEADRSKNEFLAMLAHELRNPLAAINSAARLATRPNATQFIADSLSVIERQSQNLSE